MTRVATPLLLVLLSILVAVISAGAGRYPVAVRTEKCRRNKVLPISNGRLKRVSKGAEEFLVKCDRGFKAVGGGAEAIVRCSKEGGVENPEDAPKCVKKKEKKSKNKNKSGKGKESRVKELLRGDWKRREKMRRKDGSDVQGRCLSMTAAIDFEIWGVI